MQRKIAIVTGGGSGIGFAIAKRFVSGHYTTIIVGRDEEKRSKAKALLGDWCVPMSCDLNKLPSIPSLVQNVIKEYGTIDVLVNNAGINQKKEFVAVTGEEFRHILLPKITAVFALSGEVVKHMLIQEKGAVININFMVSQYGIPKVIAYTASKSATEGMTKAMVTELSPKGIRVNCIAPDNLQPSPT